MRGVHFVRVYLGYEQDALFDLFFTSPTPAPCVSICSFTHLSSVVLMYPRLLMPQTYIQPVFSRCLKLTENTLVGHAAADQPGYQVKFKYFVIFVGMAIEAVVAVVVSPPPLRCSSAVGARKDE